jgi:hypothetical protein
MISGIAVRIGDMIVNGEPVTGILVEASKDDLRKVKLEKIFGKPVVVVPERRTGPRPKWETPEEVKP